MGSRITTLKLQVLHPYFFTLWFFASHSPFHDKYSIMNIFIPVLFICANVTCEFQQARTYFTTLEECVTAVENQHNMIANQARVLGVDNLVVKATCVTVNVTTI